MSYIKLETIRAIKLDGKTYRSAQQAALAYSHSAARRHHYLYGPKGMVWSNYIKWYAPRQQKFYRRAKPIFDRYFARGVQ